MQQRSRDIRNISVLLYLKLFKKSSDLMSENNFTSYIALGVCKDCRKKKMCPASSRGVQCNEFKPFTKERSSEDVRYFDIKKNKGSQAHT